MAGPPDGRCPGGRAARPHHPRRRRRRLRREGTEELAPQITWTTRLRKDAALHGLPPQRTGRRGRPRVRGNRLPSLSGLAATAEFAPHAVTRYGRPHRAGRRPDLPVDSVSGTRHVQVILVRDRRGTGYDLALVTTDLAAGPAG